MKYSGKEITTTELFERLEDDNLVIVDVRPVDAYNGWSCRGEIRGGHIIGAKSLPLSWANYDDWIDVVVGKGITSDMVVVLYGYKLADAQLIARQLDRAKYRDILIYNEFIEEWSGDPAMPMDSLANYKQLVSASWLKDSIESKADMVVCHAHSGSEQDYLDGHIPSSISLDLNMLEDSKTYDCLDPEQLKANLEAVGIGADTTVVLYGRFTPGSKTTGHLCAMRAAVIMLYAGVKDVKILNGGLYSWLEISSTVTDITAPTAISEFGAVVPSCPELFVGIDRVKEVLDSDSGNIISVRRLEEYCGDDVDHDHILKRGHIPGSVHCESGSDICRTENFRNLDHTTREFGEIEDMWYDMDIVPETPSIFYSSTGWRGSEALFNAYLMGWENIALFDSGWSGWSSDPKNRCVTSDPLLNKD